MTIKLSTEKVIQFFQEKHQNTYDYSLVDYKNGSTKVKIICKIHGMFEQLSWNHRCGTGCPECARLKITTPEDKFISRVKNMYNYDLSLVKYKNSHTKIKLICPIHGTFERLPCNLLNGLGCTKCGSTALLAKNQIVSQYNFINKATKVHYNEYDYSKVHYNGIDNKVEIICNTHGSFFQTPGNHLSGRGCAKCKCKSKGELFIRKYLDIKNIKYEEQKRFIDCRYKNPLPFDFYLPEYNICIEFDGIQHFRPHSFTTRNINDKIKKDNFNLIKFKDNIKSKYCFDNQIKLIRISNFKKIQEQVDLAVKIESRV